MRGCIARDLRPGDVVLWGNGTVVVTEVVESRWWPDHVIVKTDQGVFSERAYGYVEVVDE